MVDTFLSPGRFIAQGYTRGGSFTRFTASKIVNYGGSFRELPEKNSKVLDRFLFVVELKCGWMNTFEIGDPLILSYSYENNYLDTSLFFIFLLHKTDESARYSAMHRYRDLLTHLFQIKGKHYPSLVPLCLDNFAIKSTKFSIKRIATSFI